jgi:hypothetical protein
VVASCIISVGVGAGAGWQAASSRLKMAINDRTAQAPARRLRGFLFSFIDFFSFFCRFSILKVFSIWGKLELSVIF